MSQYYNPKRTRNLFTPGSKYPFRLSRSKIDLFLNCPRCFYLDRKLGVGQPPGFPFSLNAAVDRLLKKEFDTHRLRGTPHPLMTSHGIKAVPFSHPNLEEWRDSLRAGITYHHPETNFVLTGGVDDLWVNREKELIVVDYKATAKDSEVSLDADWQIGYKRQMEVYQWLFRKNNFKVSPVGYFVYCNGRMDHEAFNNKLEFAVKIIPYEGDDSWVEDTVKQAHVCLMSDAIPTSSPNCDFCLYHSTLNEMGA